MLNPRSHPWIIAGAFAIWTVLAPGATPASAHPGDVPAKEAKPGDGDAVTDPDMRVTYVANEGFLIEIAGKKILVDALFHDPTIDFCHAPDAETARRMGNSEAPFDGVDLILVTHWHIDHFTAELVLKHLAGNPTAVLVAPPQAAEKLRRHPAWSGTYESRVRAPDLELFASVELTLNGIRLEAHQWRHSPYMLTDEKTGKTYNKHEGVENLTYLVEAGGIRFLHVGDAFFWDNLESFAEPYLPRQKVHLVFLLGWSEDHKDELLGWLSPDHLVFMHLPADSEELERLSRYVTDRLANALVFKAPMEARCFRRSPRAGGSGVLSTFPCAAR